MAKKSVRLLSLLLAVLMLFSMVTVVNAQNSYTEAATAQDYKQIQYDTLVGKDYQHRGGVYIVNEAWKFKAGEEPEEVTFKFRNKNVTETYNPARHLTSVAAVYAQAALDHVEVPYCILTEGNYTTKITLTKSIYLLGARAGLNPNVPNADPTQEWALSSQRSKTEVASAAFNGESRIWAGMNGENDLNADADFKAGYNDSSPNIGNTLALVDCGTTYSYEILIDGLSFQGYGAIICDNNGGTATARRTYYVQNCIFNNGYSYDTAQIRFWNRSGNYSTKELNISNCYAYGMKNRGFYSGHASTLRVNGLAYQNNYDGAFYDACTLQAQGYNFELKNSHFYKSEAFAKEALPEASSGNDYAFRIGTQFSNNDKGTGEETFTYNITNNNFVNYHRVTGEAGSYALAASTYPLYLVIGGKAAINVEDNNFITTMDFEAGTTRTPVYLRYMNNGAADGEAAYNIATGNINHGGSTSTYALTSGENGNFNVNENTFAGELYCNTLPNIGTNTAKGTKIELSGNYYVENWGGTTGIYSTEGSVNDIMYNKWVYMADPATATETQKTNYIVDANLTFTHMANGKSTMTKVSDTEYVIDVNQDTDTVMISTSDVIDTTYGNYMKSYIADENFNKVTETGSTNVVSVRNMRSRHAYLIISILSIDGRTSKDYRFTVNRDIMNSAKMSGITTTATILNQANPAVDQFDYVVSNADETVTFAPTIPNKATAKVSYYNPNTETYEAVAASNGNYSVKLRNIETVYTYLVEVTDATGNVETFTLTLSRAKNSEGKLTSLTASAGTLTKDEANKIYTIDLPNSTTATTVTLGYSKDAAVSFKKGTVAVAGTNNKYTLSNLPVGTTTYTVAVTSQDGTATETWTVKVNRAALTDNTLTKIENATYNASTGAWEAAVNTDTFIVMAQHNGAGFELYADAGCTKKLSGNLLNLTTATTTVWVRVIAANGAASAASKLVVTTTKVGAVTDPSKEVTNNGIVAIPGAEPFGAKDPTVFVNLPAGTKEYNFAATGLNGYFVKVYADATMGTNPASSFKIVPDGRYVYLYVVATHYADKTNTYTYKVKIDCPVPVKFTDKQTDWAKKYVDALANSQLGIMKGDEHGAFNGESNLTRYEMAVMMVRLYGADASLYKGVRLVNFKDTAAIEAVTWAANYVKAAYRIGLLGGHAIYDDNEKLIGYEYKGDDNATRSEFVKLYLNAYYGKDITEFYESDKKNIDKRVTDKKFTDLNEVDEWAVPYVYFAIDIGVIKGDEGRIKPDANITRNEVATIICRKLLNME